MHSQTLRIIFMLDIVSHSDYRLLLRVPSGCFDVCPALDTQVLLEAFSVPWIS